MNLKQFVPSQVCLKCEGCCRFNLGASPWRPKVGENEELAKESLPDGYIETRFNGLTHQCRFFNANDWTCGVYDKRPFECSLYPFILSLEEGVVKCYVHLACPYVQEEINGERIRRYEAYLRDWFSSKSVKMWMEENQRLLHDYRHAKDELDYLFTLS